MVETDTMLTHELQQVNSREADSHIRDNNEQVSRQRELDKKRLIALIGSAISQLPIWGTFSR
jgi:hypothetical protein